ncbi:MAG: TrmB family transcriptional regulator sugar-binding domain-containing protein, partial [Candidatus Hodarchaeota archaeon]
EQSVSEIVKKTGIPHPRAYDTLRNLVKYGLITPKTQIEKPSLEGQKRTAKTYRAFEPEIGIGNLFAFFTYAKEEAIKELQKLANSSIEFVSGIWEVLGRENIINIVKLMIEEAEYEILMAAGINFIQKIKDSLIAASKRRVHISCVTSIPERLNTDFLLDELRFVRIKHRKNFPMPYIILDRSHAIQWNFKAFRTRGFSDPEYTQAQVIDKIDLIDTLVDHFFFLNWRLGELRTVADAPPPLPKSFIHIISAVEEIENLLQRGLTLNIVAKGSLTTTGQRILKTGQLTRIHKDWDAGEFTLFLRTDKGSEVTIGGFGAYYEDVAADLIILSL